ncbi:MAG: hypothetical protein ABF709_10365, partial [Leuconostoc pseudomesenteroides]|uniref:hypothetical protein n=1 Tax=Leuconostoc pseudomesenteroides TaxID=33968 RepID=UPI0039ECFBD7
LLPKTRGKLSSAQNFPHSQSSICNFLCQQLLLVFSIGFDLKTLKKATMIIITTDELNCCGGGWLSRGFRV